jgi:hypothetical protein
VLRTIDATAAVGNLDVAMCRICHRRVTRGGETMRGTWLLATASLVGATVGCGGGGLDQADPSDTLPETTTSAIAGPSDEQGDASAQPFPVPLVEGGEILSEFPGEVAVAYPDEMFDAVASFYEAHTVERAGSVTEFFDGGFEYQFADGDDDIVITDNPEPGRTVALNRVLP